jgi:excisionase family DNA binding protein
MPFHSDRPAHARRPPTQTATVRPMKHSVADIDDCAQLLYTEGEAAALLRIRESWLRRKVAARLIPSTFLGRHLRFPRLTWPPSWPTTPYPLVSAGCVGGGPRCGTAT